MLNLSKIQDFALRHKWLFLFGVFALVHVVVFASFWQVSASLGGWKNFYQYSQSSSQEVPKFYQITFHEDCDWHPPLYYAFTSLLMLLFNSQWAIYLSQYALSFLTLVFAFKILRLFFSEKFSFAATLLLALEPYWAWHNILIASENLSVPLFLIGLYFFFKFLITKQDRSIVYSAVFFGLTTLARANNLFITIVLSLILIALILLRKHLKPGILTGFDLKKMLKSLILFNLVFFSLLAPWLIRNQVIYGRLTIANVSLTNFYFFNLPPLLSLKYGIPYSEAYQQLKNNADRALGPNVGDQGDCHKFSREEFNRQIDFYQSETKKYILDNFWLYSKIHLIKAAPFFLQSGYLDLWSAYGGSNLKPDISSLLANGNFGDIFKFIFQMDLKTLIYILGVALWGLLSLAMLAAVVFSYFKDRDKFLFFLLGFAAILYNAILTSPFLTARYRLPYYILFFAAFVYMISIFFKKKKSSRNS